MNYVFKDPVTLGERTITEIHTHEPTLGDLCAVGTTPLGSAVADRKLLSSLCGEPESILNKISARDWACISQKMAAVWTEFFHAEESQGESNPEAVPENM